jgi:hypothetical protein
MISTNEINLSLEDHAKAKTEISFLLAIFADTIVELMGGATATVGRLAGCHMAEKLPVYLPNPDLETVLAAVIEHLSSGYEITAKQDEAGAELTFGKCAIRNILRERSIPVGGDLCKVFHFTLAGIVNQLLGKGTKGTIVTPGGQRCLTRVNVNKN